MISQADLKDILHYDPFSGKLTWRTNRTVTARQGQEAGCIHSNGYRYVIINRKQYLAHRLIWLYQYGFWPENEIDHANGIKNDNRLSNLRAATRFDNARNVKKRRSGLKGVQPNGNGWRVTFQQKYAGQFPTEEEAHAHYCLLAKAKFGEFWRPE